MELMQIVDEHIKRKAEALATDAVLRNYDTYQTSFPGETVGEKKLADFQVDHRAYYTHYYQRLQQRAVENILQGTGYAVR